MNKVNRKKGSLTIFIGDKLPDSFCPFDSEVLIHPLADKHPLEQVKWFESIAALINTKRMNFVIVTHSPYIMAHLNNLVSENIRFDDPVLLARQAKFLFLGDSAAFMTFEQVKAYQIEENGKLRDLYEADYGFRWDSLSDMSSEIQSRYFSIYEEK